MFTKRVELMETDDRIKELIIDYTEGRRSLNEVVIKIKEAVQKKPNYIDVDKYYRE